MCKSAHNSELSELTGVVVECYILFESKLQIYSLKCSLKYKYNFVYIKLMPNNPKEKLKYVKTNYN